MGLSALVKGWSLSAASTTSTSSPTGPPLAVESPWAPSDYLTVATWAGLFDNPDALPVTRAQAIAIPGVARGRDLICVSVARLPLFASDNNGRRASQPRIITRPEMGRSRFVTLVWTVDDLLFYGFSVWQVLQRYAEDGRPMTVRRVPLGQVETDPTTGEIVKCFGRDVGPFDVIRFDGPHEGVLNRSGEAVRAARRIHANYNNATGQPTPDVELHQTGGDPLSNQQIDDLVARWAAARAGANGRVAFTNQSIEAKMHGQQPEQLLISGRNAANLDVARLLGLPAWAVDGEVGGSSLTYQNVPSRSRELIDYTLAGYMEAIVGRLSLDDVLAAGVWASFSTDVLTDGDFGDRMTDGKTAIDAGIYTAEQIRNREQGIPVEGVPNSTTEGTPVA